jgi:hypothetical protein
MIAQERALTLVYVQDEPARFWATARVVGKGVGVDILRAEHVQGPWQVMLTVNFFGGFVVDPTDSNVIWVGDEARGVYRSNDAGDTFDKVQPDVAASCLAYGGDALWACTPGLPQRTALARSADALSAFEPVMAFADVTHMVECAPETDVEQVCAAAWFEWQRDVLMTIPAETAPPTMPVADAGPAPTMHEADAAAARMPDAGDVAGDDRLPAKSGCAVGLTRRAESGAPSAAFVLVFVLLARRRRDD